MRQAASLKAHQQLEQDVESGDDDSSGNHPLFRPILSHRSLCQPCTRCVFWYHKYSNYSSNSNNYKPV